MKTLNGYDIQKQIPNPAAFVQTLQLQWEQWNYLWLTAVQGETEVAPFLLREDVSIRVD